MAEIIKVFKEHIPAMRFIGKKYSEFGHWDEWFSNGWFEQIEKAMNGTCRILEIWKNGGAYAGVERRKDGEPFEYWIGMFAPISSSVPDGFDFIDFKEATLGTCWIYGKENEVHDTSGCLEALKNAGIRIIDLGDGAIYSFENCLCPRYTTPDKKAMLFLIIVILRSN